jgi:chromosome segregation ATPase
MEKTQTTVDQEIQAEIDRIRAQFPRTQDLYREACVLLFFRYGITPTANKLYQFVRKGSMSAPAEALSAFWADLRERSRVRIEHPDLPDELRSAAGDLAATLWNQAQAMAQETLAAYRADAQTAVAEANAAKTTAEEERDRLAKELTSARESILALSSRANALEQDLAAEKATRAAFESQVRQAVQDTAALQSMLEKARQEFAEEMDKLRAAAKLTEDRYRASEERALLEIDRERTAAARLQKELEQGRAKLAQASERHKTEIGALQTELGQCRQQLGALEGGLQAGTDERNRIAADLDRTRIQLTESVSQAATCRADAENLKRKYEDAAKTAARRTKAKGRTP